MTDSYTGEERRTPPPWQQDIDQLRQQFAEHYEIDEEMHTRTEQLLETIHADLQAVKEVVTAWNNVKGAGVVLSFIGRVVKWASGFAVAAGALYLLFKGGPAK